MSYKVWTALVGLRILMCLCPLTAYIHPDEFFQNSEPLAGAYELTKACIESESLCCGSARGL